MTNPLLTLDRLIWNAHEKVTRAAYQRLGWNKYDLVQIAETAGNFGMIATGLAIVGHGLFNYNPGEFGYGLICCGLATYKDLTSRNKNHIREKIQENSC